MLSTTRAVLDRAPAARCTPGARRIDQDVRRQAVVADPFVHAPAADTGDWRSSPWHGHACHLEQFAAGDGARNVTRSRSQQLSLRGQTARKTWVAENALAVVDDHMRLARQAERRAAAGARSAAPARNRPGSFRGSGRISTALNSGGSRAVLRASACVRYRPGGRRRGSGRPAAASRFSMRTIARRRRARDSGSTGISGGCG